MGRTLDRVIYLFLKGIFLLISGLCLLITFDITRPTPFIILVSFNILFLSIFFQLEENLTKKIAILSAGNLLGTSFNFLFTTFSTIATRQIGTSVETLFSLAYPILTLLWIVPFWSLSLSSLPKPQNSKGAAQFAN